MGLSPTLTSALPGGSVAGEGPRGSCPETPARSPQGTNYRKTNPALEIHRTKRDSFWAQAEVRGRGQGGGAWVNP